MPFGSTFSVRIPTGLYPSEIAMIASNGRHTRHEYSLGAIEQVYRANTHPYATNVCTTRAGICRKRIWRNDSQAQKFEICNSLSCQGPPCLQGSFSRYEDRKIASDRVRHERSRKRAPSSHKSRSLRGPFLRRHQKLERNFFGKSKHCFDCAEPRNEGL